jgi:hemerythrin superfamily protein
MNMTSKVEEVASHMMGAMKDVKAKLKGLSGVFAHLMEEHGKMDALLKRVSASSDRAVRETLYPEIRKQLLAHEQGEVRAVYPALAEYQDTSAIASAHSRNATELEAAIADVDALPYSDVGWSPAFERLVKMVEDHVEEEETTYFPKAQEVLGDERAKELLTQFEAAKQLWARQA